LQASFAVPVAASELVAVGKLVVALQANVADWEEETVMVGLPGGVRV
jgi:hypothetical protein